jgi:hypothetical protein
MKGKPEPLLPASGEKAGMRGMEARPPEAMKFAQPLTLPLPVNGRAIAYE